MVVINATHAAAALRTGFRNKMDKNDARGVADLMRVNKFRPVWVESPAAQRDRALLTVREQPRRQSLDARNTIWFILQGEGLRPPKLTSPAFQALVLRSLEDEALAPLLRPSSPSPSTSTARSPGSTRRLPRVPRPARLASA